MPRITGHSKALIDAQRQADKEISSMLARLAGELRQQVLFHVDYDGTISSFSRRMLQRVTAQLVRSYIVGENNEGVADDGRALSEFMYALNRAVAKVTRDIFMAHENYISAHTTTPIWNWLRAGRNRDRMVEEQADSGDYADLLSTGDLDYDPAHLFVPAERRAYGPYRLSDRLWQTSEITRLQIDRLVFEGVRDGRGAHRIANDITQTLLPGARRRGSTTVFRERRGLVPTPNVPYAAWRLARTEITASAGRATLAASRANPFVDRIEWLLSPNHPRIDICDSRQGIYPLGQEPGYPAHPNCLCVLVPVVTSSPSQTLNDLVELQEQGYSPGVNPANSDRFSRWALGAIADD